MRSLSNVLPRTGGMSVLEIGFGRGLMLSRFVERGDVATGVDPGMLEREISVPLRRAATLHAEPAESVILPEESFDLVYGIHVVEHLKDPGVVFRACSRWLRPGGVMYLVTPNAGSKGLSLFREAWWNLEDPTHIRFFSRRSITVALAGAGFERIRTRIPPWDSLTLEIGSTLRALGWEPGAHGVLGSRLSLPVYGVLLPAALAARALWPAISPSMEVVARRPGS
jgi:SAM-dependent methyltransferase